MPTQTKNARLSQSFGSLRVWKPATTWFLVNLEFLSQFNEGRKLIANAYVLLVSVAENRILCEGGCVFVSWHRVYVLQGFEWLTMQVFFCSFLVYGRNYATLTGGAQLELITFS